MRAAAIAALACGVVAAVATLADDDPRQPPCRDDPSFVDVGGFPCSAWRRFDCAADTLAYSDVSYTAGDMRDVRRHCPSSCGLCLEAAAHARLARWLRAVVQKPHDLGAHASLANAVKARCLKGSELFGWVTTARYRARARPRGCPR